MANTPREEPSYIVLGVKKRKDGHCDLWGIESPADEADIQSQFSDRVYPVPRFSYEVLSHDGKTFGVIVIPPDRIGPCVPVKDYGEGNALRQKQIYFRRGSRNELANPEDINRICRWVQSTAFEEDTSVLTEGDSLNWERFLEAVHDFTPSRKYLLVANAPEPDADDGMEMLGVVDWSYVVDLDPQSDQKGTLKAARSLLEARRNVHMLVKGDRPTLNLSRGTYWFFARGLEGSTHPPELSGWRVWQQQLGNEVREQLASFARASIPIPVTVVAIWYGDGLANHLQSIFDNALAVMGDSVDFVVVTDNTANVDAVASKVDGTVIAMPLHHFCSGLASLQHNSARSDSDLAVLPSSSGVPITLESSILNWIEEEIELVHLNTGTQRDGQRNIGSDFLRGQEITWHELGLRYDVERDQAARLRGRVEADLSSRQGRRGTRINLYHEPGAGGTTVAKRTIWDFHQQFPCGVLRRTEPRETIERLQRITALTGLPALILADGSDITEDALNELFEYVKALHLPVTILQVLRRFGTRANAERTTSLRSQLSGAECYKFSHALSMEMPQRASSLEQVATSQPDRFLTPFYYCLQAFGKDFQRLDTYVSSRLDELTEVQKKVLVFLAIAHHYGQKAIPAQAFCPVLGIPQNRQLNIAEALSERGFDLVVEARNGEWRTSHDLIATEVLRHLLSPGRRDQNLWKQNLSDWAKQFAYFCRGTAPVVGDTMLEIARRTFLYRDNVELLGTERANSRQFAQLIMDIPAREGRLELLRILAGEFYDQPHFWAHLGRFYAIEMHDFQQAVECADRAIALQPDDPVLHHMKGMAWRSQAIDKIEQSTILLEVVNIAKQACEEFEIAREKNPDDEHGYISEVQLISRVLDYAGANHSGGLTGYLSDPVADPFIQESLERSEDLLEQIRRNREGEGPSSYEQECRGKLDSLYGRYDEALQVWDALLTRRDVYSPPIRRQIIWTYLARKGRSWDELSGRELTRAMDLLEHNLNEEPHNDRNMRMWIQAVRRASSPPSIESVIEKVAYWQANTGSIDANFYMYVLYGILALEGSVIARDSVNQFLDECRGRARLRRNRTKSFEWVGPGKGLSRLVHHSRLGDWNRSTDFWENVQPLARVRGRIARIRGSEAGLIQVTDSMSAFFVPAKGGYAQGRSENEAVEFYLGFSYEGLRAWEVKSI